MKNSNAQRLQCSNVIPFLEHFCNDSTIHVDNMRLAVAKDLKRVLGAEIRREPDMAIKE